MKKTILILSAPLFLTLSFSTLAETKSDSKNSFDFKPVVIDSKNGTGSTVGIEYEFKGEQTKSLNSNDAGVGLNPDATIGEAVLGYTAKGTVATSKDRNPKNFLEFQLDGKYRYSASGKGSMLGGLFAKYESNQSFTSKQSVYGLGGTYGKMDVLGSNDFVAFDANYGRVDPKDDTARQAALGATPLRGCEKIKRTKSPTGCGVL